MKTNTTQTRNKLCGKATQLFYDGSRVIIRRFYCGRWDCPRCAAFKRKRWKAEILNHTGYDGHKRGYWYKDISLGDYGRVYKQIQRKEAGYFAITRDGHIGILTTKPLSSRDTFLSGSELEERLDYLLAQEAKPLEGNHKIRCSQQFTNHTKTKEEKWKAVTVAEDIKEVALEFEKRGCEVSWKNSNKERFFIDKLTQEASQYHVPAGGGRD